MKTSIKLLIFVAGFALIYLVVGLTLFRQEVQRARNIENKNFKTVPVGKFSKIKCSSNWDIRIRQGLKYEVKLGSTQTAKLKPNITLKNGTLHMTIPSADATILQARVTVPAFVLKNIEATGNSRVRLHGYQSDTLYVMMKDKSVFTVKGNKVSQLDVKTSGNAQIKLSSK